MTVLGIKALVFDTFGTVVDWRTSVAADMASFFGPKGVDRDWIAFADAWRGGYYPAMDQVRKGLRPWADNDVLMRERLDELLATFEIGDLSEGEKRYLNLAWHRLNPWPDSVPGITRLKSRYIVSTFSNGSVRCLVDMAKHAGLPWDCIFSADIVHHFKPDKETYLGVATFLNLAPQEVMVVAAHNYDLRSARLHGLATGYVNRPTEYGELQKQDLGPEEDWDVSAASMEELADAMGT